MTIIADSSREPSKASANALKVCIRCEKKTANQNVKVAVGGEQRR